MSENADAGAYAGTERQPPFPASLVLAGAGKMGAALLRAWLAAGLDPVSLRVIEPRPSAEVAALARDFAFALDASPPADARDVEALVLAVKPQGLDDVRALRPIAGKETLVLSILAGKRIADVAARLPKAGAFVRAMPNLPASVGRGMTGLAAQAPLAPKQRAQAEALIGATGAFEWVDESLIDAVTAISGSGPAYVFFLAECLGKAGEALGLSPAAAARLARATVEGAGELLFRNQDLTPEDLRRSVTSPGGTTAAALDVLSAQDGLEDVMRRATEAARRRAEALSG